MQRHPLLLAIACLALGACADASGDTCRSAAWDTGEASWGCNAMDRDCSVSPCRCATCCPASWYATEQIGCGAGSPCYFPQLAGEVVDVLTDAELPNTFVAEWAGVTASTAAPACGAEAIIPCGAPASELRLRRDSAADVRVVLSRPVEELTAIAPDGPVEVVVHRGALLGGDATNVDGIEVVDADGALLLAAHDWRTFAAADLLPHPLAGTGGATVTRSSSYYCLTLPDSCNRTFSADSLVLAGQVVPPDTSADVALDGRAYTLHHARTLRPGGRDEAACADAWPRLVSFSVVRRAD